MGSDLPESDPKPLSKTNEKQQVSTRHRTKPIELQPIPVNFSHSLPALIADTSEDESRLVAAVGIVNAQVIEDRKSFRQRIRNLASRIRGVSKNNSTRSTTCYTIGGVAGGGVLTASLVVAVTTPFSVPIIILTGAGAAVLSVGVYFGHKLGVTSNNQALQADLLDNMAGEIEA